MPTGPPAAPRPDPNQTDTKTAAQTSRAAASVFRPVQPMLRLELKNSAWLIAARTVDSWKGLVIR